MKNFIYALLFILFLICSPYSRADSAKSSLPATLKIQWQDKASPITVHVDRLPPNPPDNDEKKSYVATIESTEIAKKSYKVSFASAIISGIVIIIALFQNLLSERTRRLSQLPFIMINVTNPKEKGDKLVSDEDEKLYISINITNKGNSPLLNFVSESTLGKEQIPGFEPLSKKYDPIFNILVDETKQKTVYILSKPIWAPPIHPGNTTAAISSYAAPQIVEGQEYPFTVTYKYSYRNIFNQKFHGIMVINMKLDIGYVFSKHDNRTAMRTCRLHNVSETHEYKFQR